MSLAPADLPLVSFVIPVRDDARRLDRCLETVAANRYPGERVEVVVVDNGSTDDSRVVARRAGAAVLELPGYRVGELRNRGARIARGEVLAFVDADHELDEGWLPSAIEALGDPSIAIVGALCHAPQGGTWVQRAYDLLRGRRGGQCDVEWLGSGNMAIRRRVFEEQGGFDASLETCEDVDLCRRVRERGYRIVSDDRLRSVHAGDPATLRELFRGELWRGRDNLKASLRGNLSGRALVSALIPVVNLFMLGTGAVALATATLGGLRVAAAALAILGGSVFLRTLRAVCASPSPFGARALLEFVAVAAVYEIARALALAAGAGHAVRVGQRPGVEPSAP